ncbi:tetratricopeptide repeat protein [Dokdonia sp. R86516]|uniref:tetratricopeptide repeat protein n=1 Tax=Dokdonia sp. R86516 TaxID=3093856 RepID=UPI0037C6401A
MNKGIYILILTVFFTLSRKRMNAQQPQEITPFADENVDDLGDVSDAFQTAFFEALKQKGIENYERAITSLNKCIALEPELAILFFERGKNQVFLKNYDEAASDFNTYLDIKPNDVDVLEALYEVYFQQQDYESAASTVKKLIGFDVQYKEDLARIYTSTKRYEEALDLIEELDNEIGSDIYRDRLKSKLYRLSGNTNRQVKEIEKNIASNPKSEAEYLKLILLYSEQGDTQKAYETALELQKVNPYADEVHLALYKFNLNDGKIDDAISSMQKVLESTRMSPPAKHRVLNDFVLFVNRNPKYEPALERAIAIFDTQVADANIYQELATYYIQKGNKAKALPYLTKALDSEPENLELIKNTSLLLLDAGDFEKVEDVVADGLDLYPSQPLLYLTYGVALNKQGKFKAAIDQLELGVDYIIEDLMMEMDFYKQLGDAHTGDGDAVKAARYYSKVKELKAQGN